MSWQAAKFAALASQKLVSINASKSMNSMEVHCSAEVAPRDRVVEPSVHFVGLMVLRRSRHHRKKTNISLVQNRACREMSWRIWDMLRTLASQWTFTTNNNTYCLQCMAACMYE
jgi:hypothetical protein